MKPLSLTVRISLLFAGAAMLVLLATGYVLARAVEAHFEEQDRAELDGKLALIRNMFSHAAARQALDDLPRLMSDALVGHHGLSVLVLDARGARWFASPDADFPQALLRHCRRDADDCDALYRWEQNGERRVGIGDLVAVTGGGDYTVFAAKSIEYHAIFMDTFHTLLGTAVALAVLAMAGLGWIATRWGLAPLRQVTDTMADISAERLGVRLRMQALPAELVPLSAAFNAMLTRLNDAFQRLSEFSSDIAHELRTPISSLTTQTQVALSSARDVGAYREILYSSLEEYERMAQMVGDMLYLAQTDNGMLKPSMEIVDLAEEARGLFDYFEAWAEERGVALSLVGAASIRGDRLMMRRALSNLLSNAIRHTVHGGVVRVCLTRHGDSIAVTVENPGLDIPVAHLPRLFERFYRAEPSRQRNGEGAGLGLAIVKAIVDAQGGSIRAESSQGMTRFHLDFPARAV